MKKVLLFISIGLLLLAIPAGVFYLGQQKDIRTRAAPATTLTLTPAVQTVTVGDNLKLSVDINPGSNQVVSAAVYLTYDPAKLEAKTITNGTSAPRVLNSGIIENGTASIKVGAASNEQPITKIGTIAVVTFTAIDATGNFAPTVVQFASNTFVGGINESNVLMGTTPAKITINANSGTVTPFPTITLTPTLSPTATPTATLAPILTPTLPASGSAESSPSALQILTPEENADVTTSQPVIQGTAPPGSVITIVIHSDTTQTVTVTTDANGNWVFTPTTPLEPGPHSIVVSTVTASGETQTTTLTFVVAGAGEAGASESAVPIAGSIQTTLLLLGLGVILITSGIFASVCY